jgi:hypothetical protein
MDPISAISVTGTIMSPSSSVLPDIDQSQPSFIGDGGDGMTSAID